MLGEEGDDAVGVGAVADEVAGADDPVGAEDGQVGPGQFQGDGVAVDVGDQSELHPVVPALADEGGQLDRARVGGLDGVDQGRPGRPPRSRAWRPAMVVPAGLVTWSLRTPGCWPVSRTIFAGPEDGLRGEGHGHLAGQADADPAVGQGLDHDVDERRAAPGEAGHGVELALGDAERPADGVRGSR